MILAELFPYSRLIFTILYGITAVAIVGVVVSENRNPVKTLAWITVLVLLPVAGIVLYIFFGRSLKHVRMISRKKRRKLIKSVKVSAGTKVTIDFPKGFYIVKCVGKWSRKVVVK